MDMGLWLAFIAATGALLLLPGPDWARSSPPFPQR